MQMQPRQTSIVPGPAPTGQWHLSATYTVQCRVLCRMFGHVLRRSAGDWCLVHGAKVHVALQESGDEAGGNSGQKSPPC